MQVSGLPSQYSSTRDQALTQSSASSFRLSNGNSLGPRRSTWGHLASTRSVQGMVTTNIGVNKDLFRRRKAATDTVSDADRIASVHDEGDLDVCAHELVFTFKAHPTRRVGGSNTTYGFTSFNGVITSAFGGSQDNFEDQFRLLGRAKIPFHFNDPGQGDHGISVQVRGASSTANRGEHEFFPRDLVRWCLPNINKTERADEQARFHRPEGMPEHKMLAHLRPVTYDEIYNMPALAYKRYRDIAAGAQGDNAVRSHSIGMHAAAPAERIVRFAIAYFRAAALTKTFSALAVLVAKRLVTINAIVPVNAAIAGDYNGFLAAANANIQPIDADAAGRLATLAYGLDIAPARPRDVHVKPAAKLIADVLAAQNRGIAPANDAAHKVFKMSTLLGAAKATVGQPMLDALDKTQENAVRREVQTFCEVQASEMEKVVGIALSHSYSGDMLDILV